MNTLVNNTFQIALSNQGVHFQTRVTANLLLWLHFRTHRAKRKKWKRESQKSKKWYNYDFGAVGFASSRPEWRQIKRLLPRCRSNSCLHAQQSEVSSPRRSEVELLFTFTKYNYLNKGGIAGQLLLDGEGFKSRTVIIARETKKTHTSVHRREGNDHLSV